MKKLKQLSLILFISVGLFSCEAEKADGEITNEFLEGKQIFRCEVDGLTRVTDSVIVSSNGANVTITAYLLSKNPEESVKFKYDTFTVNLNKLATANYISSIGSIVIDETMGVSTATYKEAGKNWTYATDNFEPNTNNPFDFNFQTGLLTVTEINDKAQYFSGDFYYDLFPPKRENPNNTVPPVRIRNGFFQYVSYN